MGRGNHDAFLVIVVLVDAWVLAHVYLARVISGIGFGAEAVVGGRTLLVDGCW